MNLLELFGPINTFVFETEGVLADDIYGIAENGEKIYNVSSKDAYAIHLAINKGYKVWLVNNGNDAWLKEWQGAGIDIVHKDGDIQGSILNTVLQTGIDRSNILYMGADIPAYEAMRECALPVCPANAAPEIKGVSKYISPLKGGQGCVRDVIEKVMKLNGQWQVPA